MKGKFFWDAAGALTVRLLGIAAVVGVIVYMSHCYLTGQYLREDPALTLIAIMVFAMGAVFAVYCTVKDVRQRLKRSYDLTEN